jgi:hypothetical protein
MEARDAFRQRVECRDHVSRPRHSVPMRHREAKHEQRVGRGCLTSQALSRPECHILRPRVLPGRPICGADKVARLVAGSAGAAESMEILPVRVNGQPGLLVTVAVGHIPS